MKTKQLWWKNVKRVLGDIKGEPTFHHNKTILTWISPTNSLYKYCTSRMFVRLCDSPVQSYRLVDSFSSDLSLFSSKAITYWWIKYFIRDVENVLLFILPYIISLFMYAGSTSQLKSGTELQSKINGNYNNSHAHLLHVYISQQQQSLCWVVLRLFGVSANSSGCIRPPQSGKWDKL